MASFSSFLLALLAFGAAWLGYVKAHSILLAALLFLAVVMIGKSLQPMLLQAWNSFCRKHFPSPPLTEFYTNALPDGAKEPDAVGAKGLQVLAVTEALRPNAKNKPVYQQMVAEAMDALAEDSPLFALRLHAVRERALPERYVATLCETDGKRMRKCFRAWLRSEPLQKMGDKRLNRDMFLRDGEFLPPDGGAAARCTVFFLFDSSLPSTLPSDENT